jgi:hypothetical protein
MNSPPNLASKRFRPNRSPAMVPTRSFVPLLLGAFVLAGGFAHAQTPATREPGDASMLVTGAHVVVSGAQQSDGSMLVDRIQVGKDGLIPPL